MVLRGCFQRCRFLRSSFSSVLKRMEFVPLPDLVKGFISHSGCPCAVVQKARRQICVDFSKVIWRRAPRKRVCCLGLWTRRRRDLALSMPWAGHSPRLVDSGPSNPNVAPAHVIPSLYPAGCCRRGAALTALGEETPVAAAGTSAASSCKAGT